MTSETGPPVPRLYRFIRDRLVRPWLDLVCRPQIVGADKLPATGPMIVAANHQTAGETVIVPAMLERQVSFAAKRELFVGRRPIQRLLGWFLTLIGIHPINRSGGRASADSMVALRQLLADGGALVLFPEGSRSPDGRLYKGKTGVARLALEAGIPVFPMGLIDTQPVRRRFLPIKLAWKPRLVVGDPLDFSQWHDRAGDRAVLRYVTDQVMAAIMDLTGQRYVDLYASSYRRAVAEGTADAIEETARPGDGREVPPPRPDRTQPRADTDLALDREP